MLGRLGTERGDEPTKLIRAGKRQLATTSGVGELAHEVDPRIVGGPVIGCAGRVRRQRAFPFGRCGQAGLGRSSVRSPTARSVLAVLALRAPGVIEKPVQRDQDLPDPGGAERGQRLGHGLVHHRPQVRQPRDNAGGEGKQLIVGGADMSVEVVPAGLEPAGDVNLENPFPRELVKHLGDRVKHLGDRLASVPLIGQQLVQVEQDAAFGALGHAADVGAVG